MGPLTLRTKIEHWPLRGAFRITGHVFEHLDVLLVALQSGVHVGQGEAAGVYYKHDTPVSMIQQIEALRPKIESGLSREALQNLLPAGGARNALDCALWDLEAKVRGRAAWHIAGLEKPRPLVTTFTCGADEPQKMAVAAKGYKGSQAIKVKLTGESKDAERVRAVREAKPDAWLAVDANQGFTRATFNQLLPVLIESRVALIEQPFPIGQDSWLDGLSSPIPIAADESVQTSADMAGLVGRFQVVNIKLDKCGGLTEGLMMAHMAQKLGLDAMVGNMAGTSLAMAPAYLLGQRCQVVDLDGPLFLKADRGSTVRYHDGCIECPEALWGSPLAQAQ